MTNSTPDIDRVAEGHPLDVCACGDYRQQHDNGTGRCNLRDLCSPARCLRFRLFRAYLQEQSR